MYKQFVNRFKELGAMLETTECEFENKEIHVIKFKFNIICKCSHSRITNYYDFASKENHNCLACNKNKVLSTKRLPFAQINENFDNINCKLITI